MPRPAHTLVTWEGTTGGNLVEEFSFGLRCAPGISADDAALNAAAITCMGAFSASDGLAQHVGGNVRLKRVTVVRVKADGDWDTNADGSFQKGVWEGDLPGQAAGANLPLQAALVVSLVTNRPGPTGKGRFFIPMGRKDLEADGRISTVEQNATAIRAALFVQRVGDAVGDVVVASSKGYLSPVTAVRVGRVVDTMRSRRRDQVEDYQQNALP